MKKSFLSPTLKRVTNDVLPANSLVNELTSACAIRNNKRATRSNVQNVGNSWIFTRHMENPSDCRKLEISSNGPIEPLTHHAIQGRPDSTMGPGRIRGTSPILRRFLRNCYKETSAYLLTYACVGAIFSGNGSTQNGSSR